MKRPVGRPRALQSPEQAWKLGMAYFKECDKDNEPYLITGLALALGLPARQSLCEYERREEYTDVIKKLKGIVEAGYEKRALTNNPAGPIFVLKNMGWSDRQDLSLSGGSQPIKVDSKIDIVLHRPDDGNHKDP